MEFLSFDVSGKSLALKKAEIPKPAADEVRIRVAYAGICGTDLHILDGSFPCKKTGPLTLGHEFSGTVDAVGTAVTCFQVGQRVVVDPNSGCDKCDHCHGGNYHFCTAGGINNTIGIYRDGGWATHALVPERQVHLIPDGIEFHVAALAEPLSCLAHGWDIVNPVNVGTKVLILGAGIIGLLWACLLHLHGLRKTVTVSEPQERRRKMVTGLGPLEDSSVGLTERTLPQTPKVLLASTDTLVQCEEGYFQIQEIALPQRPPFGVWGSPRADLGRNTKELDYETSSPRDLKEGYDLVVDCSGSGPAMEAAVPLLRRGGRICVFGVASPTAKLTVEPFQIYMKELTIVGVNINPFTFPKALALLQAMSKKYLSYERLGIKVFALSQYREALEALKNGSTSKAVFKL